MRQRAIYHITHCDNLSGIISHDRIWSDAQRRKKGFRCTNVGYDHIKERRMLRPVACHSGTTLGQYVPFNFCYRSVMLYVVSKGHENYRGGQGSIVHLVSSVGKAVDVGHKWAFTDRHADLKYARFRTDLKYEDEVKWNLMDTRMWGGDSELKERMQAEFLVFDSFPWSAVEAVGVRDQSVERRVRVALEIASHQPPVRVRPHWYY